MDNIDDDTYSLLSKRVYDMAGTIKGIKVHLNGERIKINGFKQVRGRRSPADNSMLRCTSIRATTNLLLSMKQSMTDGRSLSLCPMERCAMSPS
jgi:hypothetical protein